MFENIKNRIDKEQYLPTFLGIFVNPFYIARTGLHKAIKEFGPSINGRTLDVGCGTKPYEKYFSSTEYVGLEIETTLNREIKKADYFYDGEKFPFKNEEFDSVITNQVLEHVFNPDEFLSEINRVMKPKGKLLLTVPFVWDEHEQPYDYARYSSFGLKALLEKSGFKIISLQKSRKDFSVLAQLEIAYFYKKVRKVRSVKIIFTLVIFPLMTLAGILSGAIFPDNEDLYLDNIVLAEKEDNV